MDTKAVDTELEEVGVVDTGDDEAISSTYEVGYHLLSTLSEEEVPQVVTKLMDALKAEGAAFVGERFPSLIELAYPIAKRVASKKTNYDTAYFGWVAFDVSRDAILRIKTLLDANPNVLRYLIVTTSKEAVLAAMSGAASAPTGSIEKPKRSAEEGGEVSEAALDQAIETMVTEDAKTAE